ncbi:hypothetical protein WDU94_008111 [Cyamophila willieti]
MSDNHGSGPGPVPNRWMHCPRKAVGLLNDQFIAFKTPLAKKFNDQVLPEHRFTPKMIIDYMNTKKTKLGLWIDLTKTSRFYDKSEVEEHDISYTKIACEGHQEAPNRQQTSLFIRICSNFMSTKPLEKIGVHCTHGFNRTGFLLISYLVEELHYDVSAAIYAFAMVRPPGIYKAEYLRELFERYDDEPCNIPAPPLPDWCFEEDPPESFNGSNDEPSSSKSFPNSHNNGHKKNFGSNNKSRIVKNPIFMAGVSGVKALYNEDKVLQLQNEIKELCNYDRWGFPGSQPVSMDRTNIHYLAQKKYMVSWKADGTRYMMYIKNHEEIYFTDRDFSMYKISGLTFPHRKDAGKRLSNTLLDGEMVIDRVQGQSIPRYLVYDIIRFDNNDVMKQKFSTRLQIIKVEIIEPRYRAMQNNRINKLAEPFSIRAKDFWTVDKAGYLLSDKFTLCHEPDGLIFQPVDVPYTMGPASDTLKWKPHTMNSIDFLMKIETQTGLGMLPTKIGHLFVGSGNSQTPFGQMKVNKATRDLDGKIVECKWENNAWVFMRERTDKSFPNAVKTAQAVWESIQHPVTKEGLLSYIDNEVYDKSMMPPPPKMPCLRDREFE